MSKWSDEQVKFCSNMIHYYMDKYIRERGMFLSSQTYEDLQQNVWVKLLEYKKANPDNEIFTGLIEKCVKEVLVDYIRREKTQKRDNSKLANINLSDLENDRRTGREDDNEYQIPTTDRNIINDDQIAKEWLDLIPINDPDYELCVKWMKFFLEYLGYKDYGIHPPKTKDKRGYTDQALAHYLGFNGTGPSRYKRVNNKMKSLVTTYLGTP